MPLRLVLVLVVSVLVVDGVTQPVFLPCVLFQPGGDGVVVVAPVCQPVLLPWLQPGGAASPRQPILPPRSNPGATRPKLGELAVPLPVPVSFPRPYPVSFPRPCPVSFPRPCPVSFPWP